MANEAKTFEWRAVSYLPVIKQVFQDGIEMLFGWVPWLSQVVVEFHLVHGEDSNVCICIGSQQDALGIGEEVHGCSRNSTPVRCGMRWATSRRATGSFRSLSCFSVAS